MRGLTLLVVAAATVSAADVRPPNAGRGAATVPLWNPHRPAAGNRPLTVRVLVLNYDPLVPAESHRRLSRVFGWGESQRMAVAYQEALEYASGGYLRFEIVEWRNLNEIYAREDGHRPTVAEYVRNRRAGGGWGEHGNADYPRLLREQNVVPLVDAGRVDEVWIFSDHYFGLWEASMAGPGAFFINGGVYPQVPSRRPFAFYGFNYERGVAEMLHNTAHRTEATMNRAYGSWDLKAPRNAWDRFSANHNQSNGLAGVGTCHWPANAAADYDYGNTREVASWADAFLTYPRLELTRRPVSRSTWSRGPDYHLDYMKWYFAHLPRAAGVSGDGRQNNWYKYIFDFQSYDAGGQPLPPAADLLPGDVADPSAADHLLAVAYRSAEPIDPASLDDADLTVTGPDGKPLRVRLVDGAEPGGRTYRVARYRVEAPNGSWERAPASEYAVTLKQGEVRTAEGTPLPGRRLGTFRVAGTDRPAALAADADTTLLAGFEGTASPKPGPPTRATGLRYEQGVVGRGVVLAGAPLRYPAAKVLDARAGTVELWLRPRWDGNSGRARLLFQAGAAFDNGLLIQVDGANNLRLMTWGDDPATAAVERNVERGVGTSVAGWRAGDWHHVAASWADGGRRLALYVDGRLADSTDRGVLLPAKGWSTLSVGGAPDGTASVDAVVDELRISRRARTADEVRATATVRRPLTTLAVEVSLASLTPGGRSVARAVGKTAGGQTQEVTRAVAWASSDAQVATVDETGTVRAGRPGAATLTARLGRLTATATVRVTDPGLPTARLLKATSVTRPGPDAVTLEIAYDAPAGIRRESLGQGDVRVVGPTGRGLFAELVAARLTDGGMTATYRVPPPAGAWGDADRGTYTVELQAFRVVDTNGRPAAEATLGRFRVLSADKMD